MPDKDESASDALFPKIIKDEPFFDHLSSDELLEMVHAMFSTPETDLPENQEFMEEVCDSNKIDLAEERVTNYLEGQNE